jgi:hypothetical protein
VSTSTPNASRKRANAREDLDFTVPTGAAIETAVSASVSPTM